MVAGELGEDLTEEDIKEMIQGASKDKGATGKISREEFKRILLFVNIKGKVTKTATH